MRRPAPPQHKGATSTGSGPLQWGGPERDAGFGGVSHDAGLAHRAERRSRKSEVVCSSHATSTMLAVIAHSAEHLVGIEEAPGSKPGDGTNRPCSPIGRGPGLNPEKCGFDARRGYALVAQLAEAAVSNAACCRFDSCAAHQPFLLFTLPSPSGKGIALTYRHSGVRVP